MKSSERIKLVVRKKGSGADAKKDLQAFASEKRIVSIKINGKEFPAKQKVTPLTQK
jgi:hypothetical protein